MAEDCVASGSVGQRLAAHLEQAGCPAKTVLLNCGDSYVPHGALPLLKRDLQLDRDGIVKNVLEVLNRG